MNTDEVTTWFMVFARASGLFLVLPITGSANVPPPLRIALAALVAFLTGPLLGLVHAANWADLILKVVVEAFTGLAFGFVCRMVFYSADIAATILSNDMGLSLSGVFNSVSGGVSTVPSTILYWLTLIILFGLDLHHALLVAFQETYQLVGVGGASVNRAAFDEVLKLSGRALFVAAQITAPLLACSFIISLVFALLGRVVPQMNVFSESFPVRAMAGMTVFGLTCTLMAQHIASYVRRLPGDMERVAQLLSGG